MSEEKECPVCTQTKALDQYWKGQYCCIECQKYKQKNSWLSRTPQKRLEQHLKYKYGVTHAEFLQQWDAQQGCCAICKDALPDLMTYDNRRRGYAIDHNHETGEFRGILCTSCNSMLGMAKDSIEVLREAIKYLDEQGSYATNTVAVDNMRAAKKRK
jgi:hypothetical protein